MSVPRSPETDEVEADPQTVQIPPAESFEVLRRASEEELRAQERGEQLNPLESGRAAITIALTRYVSLRVPSCSRQLARGRRQAG